MTSLAIDTTGRGCSVAIELARDEGGEIFQRSQEIGRGQSEIVISQLQEVVSHAGIQLSDISRVLVTIGPGSFTGISVGVSLARGIALANDCAIFGALSTDVVRVAADSLGICLRDAARVLAVIDAGRGEIYGHQFNREGSVLLHDGGPFALAPAAVSDYVTGNNIDAVMGPGVSVIQDELGEISERALIIEGEAIASAAYLLKVEEARLVDGADVRPFYLRPPDAKPQLHKTLARREARRTI